MLPGVKRVVTAIDSGFKHFERRYGCRALRYSLAFVFIWFGITKPLAISPADQVVRPTLAHTPILSEFVSFRTFFSVLGLWEALVGIGLLWRRTVRIAVICMCLQMLSTFTPLFVIPAQTFQWWPLVPSAPGFYIVKNFALATAGLVVASLDSEPLWKSRKTSWIDSLEMLSKKGQRRIGTLFFQGGIGTETDELRYVSLKLLHAGLALVFVWSGVLMVTVSPTPGQWVASVVPNTLIANNAFIPLLGVVELAIGLYLLISGTRATHVAAYLVVVYIVLVMLPVVIHPEQVFVTVPFEPSFEGVYIFKDLILASGVLVIDVYNSERSTLT